MLAAAAKRMGFRTYAESCLWADTIRNQKQYSWTKPLHYMNVSRQHKQVAQGNCLAGSRSRSLAKQAPRCVSQAVQYFHARWQDAHLSQIQRDEALLFMSHFVVDLHQPLHVGYEDDRGGTRTQVIFAGKLMSLHSLWDSEILYCGSNASWRTLGKQLYRQADYGVQQGGIDQWADESLALTRVIYDKLEQRLGDAYCERFHPLAMTRLALASSRLASLLSNAPFGGAPSSDKVQSAPTLIERISALWKSILILLP